jgi:hypothetical protein
VFLTLGQNFTVTVDPNDLWNAGALPRWSNADGLTAPRVAVLGDESGEAPGTVIGQDFGLWTQGLVSLSFGTLVGKIGAGDFFGIGTSFSGPANATGELKLYYWDSNNGDNTQFVTATISAVPEPSTWAMMIIAPEGRPNFASRPSLAHTQHRYGNVLSRSHFRSEDRPRGD